MNTRLSLHVMNNQTGRVIENRLVLVGVNQVRAPSISITFSRLLLSLKRKTNLI